MKPLITLAFSFTLIITLSAQNPIIGGITAEPEQFPWMASITVADGGSAGIEQGCGATLIAPDWILTAGHCILDIPGFIEVEAVIINSLHLNQDTLEDYTEVIEIEEYYIHEDYSDFFNGGDGTGPDIALIKLSQPSIFTPVALANISDSLYWEHGMPGITMGWGITETSATSDSLLYANVSIYGDEECADAFNNGGYYALNAGGNICCGYFPGDPVGGAGSGDSGGPLIFMDANGDYKQVGIVSGGDGDQTEEDSPGVFTFIPGYRDWINSFIDPDATSISQVGEENISIHYFSNNRLTIQDLSPTNEYQFNIYDLSGRIVFQEQLRNGNGSHDIDVQEFNASFYVVEVINLNEGYQTTYKFVVK